nr:hypothetical protein [Streptomyces sp. TLI_235]
MENTTTYVLGRRRRGTCASDRAIPRRTTLPFSSIAFCPSVWLLRTTISSLAPGITDTSMSVLHWAVRAVIVRVALTPPACACARTMAEAFRSSSTAGVSWIGKLYGVHWLAT